MIAASRLRHRVTILQAMPAQESAYGTISASWVPLATDWAEVQDMIPSRGERLADGVEIANRPCRVRMRWRTDVTSAMRLRIEGRAGEYRIVGGPAELGWRDAIELVAEQLTSEGDDT